MKPDVRNLKWPGLPAKSSDAAWGGLQSCRIKPAPLPQMSILNEQRLFETGINDRWNSRRRSGQFDYTSKWIKTKGPAYRGFDWQGGYGAFSVSESKRDEVERYIQRQEEHQRRFTFQEEFRQLCAKRGIEVDERYVWD